MNNLNSTSPKMTAMVLAASRNGVDDPVARIQDRSHKCLVEIDGIAMIQRVLQALIDTRHFEHILVSIENEQVLKEVPACNSWLEEGVIEVIPSQVNIADSLLILAETYSTSLPLLITTGDNVLHTPELINDFVNQVHVASGDVAIAVTNEETVLTDYPDAGIGFFRFKDAGYSFCNLYAIRTLKGFDAAKIFRTGGQFRKRPWRILQVFGLWPLIVYKFRLASMKSCLTMIAGKLGISIDPVILTYSYAPIDVDNEKSYILSEKTLEQRNENA